MITAFNPNREKFFTIEGIKKLDFEVMAGILWAFEVDKVRAGEEMVPYQNCWPVCIEAAILPEAFELVQGAPLLAKTILAASQGVSIALDFQEHLNAIVKQVGMPDNHAMMRQLQRMADNLNQLNNMLMATIDVVTRGRDEALKMNELPLDPKPKRG